MHSTPYSVLDTIIGSIGSFLSMTRASGSSSVQRGLDFSLDTDNSSKLKKLQEQQAIIQKQIEQRLVRFILVWGMAQIFVWCIPLFDFQCTKNTPHINLVPYCVLPIALKYNTFICAVLHF